MVNKQTIRALKRGEPAAWEALVADYGDRLYRSARRFGVDEHTAEDLVQETYVHFAASLGRFRRACGLYSWLHGILLNRFRRHLRKGGRLVVTGNPPEAASSDPSIGGGLDDLWKSRLLVEALDRLPKHTRELVVLHYFEDLPVAEISRRVKVPAGTVKSRLFHARKTLRQMLPTFEESTS